MQILKKKKEGKSNRGRKKETNKEKGSKSTLQIFDFINFIQILQT
jgi:hypothetical protein